MWPPVILFLSFLLIAIIIILILNKQEQDKQKPIIFPDSQTCTSNHLFASTEISKIHKATHPEAKPDGPYYNYNPSICQTDFGYIFAIRLCNFTYKGEEISRAERKMNEGKADYVNSYTTLRVITSSANSVVNSRDIPLFLVYPDAPKLPKGFEDIRLLKWNGAIYGVANKYCVPRGNRMHLLKLGTEQLLHNRGIDNIRLDNSSIVPLISPLTKEGSFDKNWTPFVWNNKLFFSYTIFPHVVLEYDPLSSPNCPVRYKTGRKNIFLRGGSQAIKIKNYYIGCAHVREGLKYTHYFYAFQPEPPFAVTHMSSAFVIGKELYQKDKVQLVAGIMEREGQIILTYGENDFEAYVVKLPTESVLSSLHPIS